MMFKRQHLVIAALFYFLAVTLSAQDEQSAIQQLKSTLESKNMVFFAIKSPGETGVFIGVQYLKGTALIMIHAKVPKDNEPFVEASLDVKNYQKTYKDLNMMMGNTTALIYDFQSDGLKLDPNSGDFIKESKKAYYLNQSYKESGFETDDAYKSFVEKYRGLSTKWMTALAHALK